MPYREHPSSYSRRLFSPNAQRETMIRAIIDDGIRRVCAILAGMAAMAVTVVMVTIMIHDRIQ